MACKPSGSAAASGNDSPSRVRFSPIQNILEEATSNLDTNTEQLIQQCLATLMHGRTSFVIAHPLSTIAGANLLVVVENGRISQTGTHAELMEKGGKYRTMVEQQIHVTLGRMAPGQNPLLTAAEQLRLNLRAKRSCKSLDDLLAP